ncbi:MAG: hypothetical protein HYX21_01505 [Candidatus Yanofskybacteria bacterium]|nr:hypothetical protein [Candidatus Yanofskybacteria bacterium]
MLDTRENEIRVLMQKITYLTQSLIETKKREGDIETAEKLKNIIYEFNNVNVDKLVQEINAGGFENGHCCSYQSGDSSVSVAGGQKTSSQCSQQKEKLTPIGASWVDGPTILEGEPVVFMKDGQEVSRGTALPFEYVNGSPEERHDGMIGIKESDGSSFIVKRSMVYKVEKADNVDRSSNPSTSSSRDSGSSSGKSSSQMTGPSQPGHESFGSASSRGAFTGSEASWNSYSSAAAVAERDCGYYNK